jgi:transcriptional regulator with XRE-family HTH domain
VPQNIVAERLRIAMERAGTTAPKVAAKAKLGRTVIYDILAGRARSPRHDTLTTLAAVLDVSVAWLAGEQDLARDVPLVGYVGAGAEVFPFDDDVELVAAPPGLGDAIAVEVRGESMWPVYRPGDRLFAETVPDLAADRLAGRDCVVQVAAGPRLVKRLRRGSKRGTWTLVSYRAGTAPRRDARLTAAAVIRWVLRG